MTWKTTTDGAVKFLAIWPDGAALPEHSEMDHDAIEDVLACSQ